MPFQLELNDRDSLVNLLVQKSVPLVVIPLAVVHGKTCAGIVGITFHRQLGQRYQVDAVSVLEDIQIAVLGRDPDHIGDTGSAPGGCSHPDHIVVAPLNIHRVMSHQIVHNQVRVRSPVIDVAHHMEMIHHQTANQSAESDDQARSTLGGDHGMDDFIVVGLLVRLIRPPRHQLLHNVGKLLRHGLAHLRPGVFGRRAPADPDQAVDRDSIPLLHIRLHLLHLSHLQFRIIDQRGQRLLL